jgi:hypothetical protein
MLSRLFQTVVIVFALVAVVFVSIALISGSSHFSECKYQGNAAYEQADKAKEYRFITTFGGCFIEKSEGAVTAFSTFVLAIFTILLSIVAFNQTSDTRILQRAYLSVRPAGIHMLRNRNEAVAHIEICNAGNLPATHVKWFIRHNFCSNSDWKIGRIDTHLVEGSGNVLAPHAKMRHGGKEIAVGPEALRHQEGLYLYIWGAVTYRDGSRRRRQTTFCHRYNCVNVTNNLQWGFAAMSGITSRDHRYGNSAN